MDAPFPFGFPFPTAAYLTLYVLMLVVHVVFMNYVLAGTGFIAWASLFTGGPDVQRQKSPTALMLRDWMPFALSAAITAGVTPLLFIQILYKKQFYTANLLLFHRWMAILPVLIVGFYLLYLLKSRMVGAWPVAARAMVGCGAFLCFAFTGYSWTENHLLSTHREVWADFYAAERMVYFSGQLLPRLSIWFLGALPTLGVLVGWQLWAAARRGESIAPMEHRRISRMSLIGLLLAVGAAGWYYASLSTADRAAVTGVVGLPYLLVAVGGVVIQGICWVVAARRASLSARHLTLCSAGLLMTVTGMTVVREVLRLASVDITALYEQHERAARVGGLAVFLFFLAANTVLVAWCFRIVSRGMKKAP